MKIELETDKSYHIVKFLFVSVSMMLTLMLISSLSEMFEFIFTGFVSLMIGYSASKELKGRIATITEKGLEVKKENYTQLWVIDETHKIRLGKFIFNTYWIATFDNKNNTRFLFLGLKPTNESKENFLKLTQ